MNRSRIRELAVRFPGRVQFNESLAKYTTYRIGGPAAALLAPRTTEDVVETVRFCSGTGTSWVALGLGSNVLIADSGFDGVVVRLGKGMDWVEKGFAESEVWRVGAGLPTPRLARLTARDGLGGVHRLIGVPGSVGGGIVMNAGAHGQQYADIVRAVDLVEADGSVRTVSSREIGWQYRDSGLGSVIVTSATIAFVPADPKGLARDIRTHLEWRRAGTPFDEPCCGSVFRNPGAGRTAGGLIDAAGFKGLRVGGAQVSQKHANYIVNVGGATARDVRAVIDAVREGVLARCGVELTLEVRIIE